MGANTRKIDVIYLDTMEERSLVVTLGDSIRGQDWARGEYPNDQQLQDERGSMYAVFLSAKRARAPHTDATWLDWLDLVTIPDDEEAGSPEVPAEGESNGPPSAT